MLSASPGSFNSRYRSAFEQRGRDRVPRDRLGFEHCADYITAAAVAPAADAELIPGADDARAVEHDFDDLLALHHAVPLVGQRGDDLLRPGVDDLAGRRPARACRPG